MSRFLPIPQALVVLFVVIMGEVRSKNAAEHRLAEDDDAVDALGPNTANETFAMAFSKAFPT